MCESQKCESSFFSLVLIGLTEASYLLFFFALFDFTPFARIPLDLESCAVGVFSWYHTNSYTYLFCFEVKRPAVWESRRSAIS